MTTILFKEFNSAQLDAHKSCYSLTLKLTQRSMSASNVSFSDRLKTVKSANVKLIFIELGLLQIKTGLFKRLSQF